MTKIIITIILVNIVIRGRPIIAIDIKHFYDYRIGHFQNRCADKII